MKKALLIVDVQNDFCEGGSLAVPGGARVARDITNFLKDEIYEFVIASRDWHLPLPNLNGGHFAEPGSEPDYVDSWPVHCVQHTWGAEYHADLLLPETTIHVVKGMGRPDYSAFQGETHSAHAIPLALALKEMGVTDLDVVGLATEHCVRASALHSVQHGFHTRVLTDLVAGIDAVRIAEVLTSEFPSHAVGVL